MPCVDKTTALPQSSVTAKQSVDLGVFRHGLQLSQPSLGLEAGRSFPLAQAWVEDCWRYECVKNEPVLARTGRLQLVLEAPPKGDTLYEAYALYPEGGGPGTGLSGRLVFGWQPGQDSLKLYLHRHAPGAPKPYEIVDSLYVSRERAEGR